MMYSLIPFTLELCFNILRTETSTYHLQKIYKVDSNIGEILALCGIYWSMNIIYCTYQIDKH